MLLVRILFAKVNSPSRLRSILQDTPLRPETEGWNFVGWVKDAAMWYAGVKSAARRFDGTAGFEADKVAPWSMLEGVELEA
ncbi:hypothetical protein HRG_012065 [Hirsutella rhossiliensis]